MEVKQDKMVVILFTEESEMHQLVVMMVSVVYHMGPHTTTVKMVNLFQQVELVVFLTNKMDQWYIKTVF